MVKKCLRGNNIAVALALLFTLFAGLVSAQSRDADAWSGTDLKSAATAINAEYLGEEEKQVILYLNLIRLNGPLFSKTFLATYLDTSGVKTDKWVKSLRKQLDELKPLPPLHPAKDLYEQALFHAKDMGRSGRIGHISSAGKDFRKRFQKFSSVYRSVGENCDYGRGKALEIVMSLLIDQGVSDLGHRKNILNKDYRFMGVAIEPHKKFRVNCVMDFGGEKILR